MCTRMPFAYLARKLYEFPAVTKVTHALISYLGRPVSGLLANTGSLTSMHCQGIIRLLSVVRSMEVSVTKDLGEAGGCN